MDGSRGREDFFSTVAFECETGATIALHFTLTLGEKANRDLAAVSPKIRRRIAALLEWRQGSPRRCGRFWRDTAAAAAHNRR